MPTIYTEELLKNPNMSVKDFAMLCVDYKERNYESILNNYYTENETLKQELAALEILSDADAEQLAKKEYDEAITALNYTHEQWANANKVYDAMSLRVQRWEPFSARGKEAKDAILHQLDVSYYTPLILPQPITGEEYRNKKRAQLQMMLGWYDEGAVALKRKAEQDAEFLADINSAP